MKKYVYLVFVALFVCFSYVFSSAQTILTVAGKGFEGYYGDTGLAINCQIHWPEAIAVDDSNNKYIADANNNVIRKVDAHTGVITSVIGTGYGAGSGLGGFSGDGGPASAARLYYPSGIAIDPTGVIYIADQRNNRIRMVDASGVITTVAGTGIGGFGGDGGAAVSAMLNHPTRVSLDASGNIYVADSGNNRIRMIDPSGTINSIAGTGGQGYFGDGGLAVSAVLFNPIDMAVDLSGNVYIADYVNNRIRKIDVSGTISTYAGIGIAGFSGDNGPATAANIYEPSGIVVDAGGNVYFSDLANFRVRKIDAAGIITTVAGNGTAGYNGDGIAATAAQLWFPEGLALDARGQLFVADKGNNRVRLISGVLAVNTVAGDGAGLDVYPNPNNGDFRINIRSPFDEDARVVITSVTGEVVSSFNMVTNSPMSVSLKDTRDIAAGTYFLSAVTPHYSVNKRLIIR